MDFHLRGGRFLLTDPPIPEDPPQDCPYAAPGDDGNRGDTLLEDSDEADDEYDDGARVLYNDC